MWLKWLSVWRFFVYLYHRFFEDHCPGRAAALAYTTLLSIVPLMLFSFYILSYFPILQGTGKQFESFILTNFVASSATVIEKQLQVFLTHIQVLSWVNIIFLGVISVLLIYNMVCAVNDVWHVKMERHLALSFVFLPVDFIGYTDCLWCAAVIQFLFDLVAIGFSCRTITIYPASHFVCFFPSRSSGWFSRYLIGCYQVAM